MAQRIAMRRSLRSGSSSIKNGPIQSYFLTTISPLTTTAASATTATVIPNIVAASNYTPLPSPMATATAHSQSYHTILNIERSQHRTIHTTPTLHTSNEPTPSPSDETGDPPSIIDPETECPPWQNPIIHETQNTKIMLDDYPEGEAPIAPLPPLDLHGDGRVLASPEMHALADEIVLLNMVEVKELVDRIAEHFGIEDDGMAGFGGGGVAASAAGGEEEAKKEEEKTAFDIKLTAFDAKTKIKVIKEVRAMTALGLKEAKAMVDDVPSVLKSGVSKDEAEEMKAKLEGLGATVEVV